MGIYSVYYVIKIEMKAKVWSEVKEKGQEKSLVKFEGQEKNEVKV